MHVKAPRNLITMEAVSPERREWAEAFNAWFSLQQNVQYALPFLPGWLALRVATLVSWPRKRVMERALMELGVRSMAPWLHKSCTVPGERKETPRQRANVPGPDNQEDRS